AIRDLMARTTCFSDPSLDAEYPARWPAIVEIALRDGRVVRTRVDDALGEPRNPVDREALLGKFRSLAAGLVSETESVAMRVLALDDERDLSRIGPLLRSASVRVTQAI
ncbi:MAG TPA: MmgE/PrpD family protein, partial [Candidatus Limnocylindria bacterium]|nr:MmgE/PrpD family protein [Candidatus Limnocylindria bacterium]